ncbi:MAG: hypothetical protein ABIK48_04860 [candidate division WOR-3 bacterium]
MTEKEKKTLGMTEGRGAEGREKWRPDDRKKTNGMAEGEVVPG